MGNKHPEKNLNVRIWGRQKELNVDGADAVVCITFTRGEEKTEVNSHIEGGFAVRDYMETFEQIVKVFGKKHLMMYLVKDTAEGLMRRIMEDEDEDKDTAEPAAGGDGAGTDLD